MRKTVIVLFTALLFIAPHMAEARSGNYLPVTKYVDQSSVLGSYYAHYVDRYGKRYPSATATFRSFCQVLRTSDLLADELIQAGVPTDQIYSILRQLEETDIRSASRSLVRRMMLTVDFALESIESDLGRSHRSEFRREVLAQVPPLSHTG